MLPKAFVLDTDAGCTARHIAGRKPEESAALSVKVNASNERLMCYPPQSCCASRLIRTQPVPQVALTGDKLPTVDDLGKVLMQAALSWDFERAEGARLRTQEEMRALPPRWLDGAPPP